MYDVKIIASTKILPEIIDKAIKKGLNNFKIYSETDTLKFYNNSKSIEMGIGYVNNSVSKNFTAKFNHLQWYKLSEFLKQLCEQPIVLEFDQIDDDKIEIKLIQFIHKL